MLRQFNMDDQTYMCAEIRMGDTTVTSCLTTFGSAIFSKKSLFQFIKMRTPHRRKDKTIGGERTRKKKDVSSKTMKNSPRQFSVQVWCHNSERWLHGHIIIICEGSEREREREVGRKLTRCKVGSGDARYRERNEGKEAKNEDGRRIRVMADSTVSSDVCVGAV